ncbi:MAG: DsbA family oxidoreductase [Tsuneonella sp.]
MTARVSIDIWSDVMCPWCIIGYKQLETALEQLAGEIEADVSWLPFELNPDMPAHGEDSQAHIARKYGRTPQQAEAAREGMAERARAAGYSFAYTGEGEAPPAMMWNTFAAHKLLRWALAAHGAEAQTHLKLALFDAHFQQRRRIGERDVLLAIAEEQGFARAEAAAALDDEVLGADVRAEERRAWEHNITGVPAMVIDGKFLVPGAQDPATYANVIRRVVERRSAVG